MEAAAAPQPTDDGNGLLARTKTRNNAAPAHANGLRKLVCYSYSISGVSYETAQDVTGLEERTPSGQASRRPIGKREVRSF